MLRTLILPLGIYHLRTKMHSIEARIRKMESRPYLDLQARKEMTLMKRTLAHLHEQEAALLFSLSV